MMPKDFTTSHSKPAKFERKHFSYRRTSNMCTDEFRKDSFFMWVSYLRFSLIFLEVCSLPTCLCIIINLTLSSFLMWSLIATKYVLLL